MATTVVNIDQILYTTEGKHLVMGTLGNVCFISRSGEYQHKYYKTLGLDELQEEGFYFAPVVRISGVCEGKYISETVHKFSLKDTNANWKLIHDGTYNKTYETILLSADSNWIEIKKDVSITNDSKCYYTLVRWLDN